MYELLCYCKTIITNHCTLPTAIIILPSNICELSYSRERKCRHPLGACRHPALHSRRILRCADDDVGEGSPGAVLAELDVDECGLRIPRVASHMYLINGPRPSRKCKLLFEGKPAVIYTRSH